MKILHIIDSMGLGGAQTVVKGIFEKQKENKNIYFYSLRKRDINTKIEHINIFGYNSSSKFSLIPILELRKIIKKNNIDILHCHLAKSQIFGGILKTFFFPNIKLIFHEHGEIFQKGKLYPFLMNLFKNKVNIYLAVSKATKNIILEKTNFEEKKIKVLYNFVDLEKFKKLEDFNIGKERKKYGLKENDFVIGFASRLYEGKGWKEFIGAAKLLVKQGYDLQFIIGGEGEDKEKINNFIKENNLEKNVKIIGYIDNMVYFYNMIDLFVFPSHREALPMTILEVNAIGKPLIASNINGVNEILKDNYNALLFEKLNMNSLVKKIIIIYNDFYIRKNIIENGFKEIKQYNLKNYIKKLFNFYNL